MANAFGGYLQSSAAYNQALASATTLGFQLWAKQAYQLGMTTGYITPQAQVLYGPTDYFVKFFDPVLKNQHAQGIIKAIRTSPQGVQAAQDVSKYTAKAGYLSKYAGYLKGAGTALTIVSGAVQGGMAVVEDVQNNAGVVITASDALGYAGATTALLMAPQLAALDLVTGGGVSGGIHNAIEAQYVIPKVVFGSVNSQEATAIKSSMTKTWATKAAWNAGEYYANTPAGEAVTDCLAKFF
jgi:hypothetical protein